MYKHNAAYSEQHQDLNVTLGAFVPDAEHMIEPTQVCAEPSAVVETHKVEHCGEGMFE